MSAKREWDTGFVKDWLSTLKVLFYRLLSTVCNFKMWTKNPYHDPYHPPCYAHAGMDQATCKIPNLGHASDSWRLQTKLVGAIAHGRTPARNVFISYRLAGDTNFYVEVLMQMLKKVTDGDFSNLPPVLFLQMDNTSSTNKNNIQLAFNALLIDLGICSEMWINFCPRTHPWEHRSDVFSGLARFWESTTPEHQGNGSSNWGDRALPHPLDHEPRKDWCANFKQGDQLFGTFMAHSMTHPCSITQLFFFI